MDWWHVALDIRPPSASSSSTGATKSSSSQSSGTDLFARDLAAAAMKSQTSAAAKAPASTSKHSSTASKPSSTSKPASSGKPKSTAHSDDSSGKSSSSTKAANSHAVAKAKGSSVANAAAEGQSSRDGSAPEDAATAATSADGSSSTNGASKGRVPARAATKTGTSQSAGAKAVGDAIDDPTADPSNQSGMSLLQLLAQSLQGDDSAAPATDSTTSAATDEPAADGTDATSNDPNAMALAMFNQALAAALGLPAAAQQTPISNATPAAAGDATGTITSSSGSSSVQDLMSLLAQNVAADAKGKSDAAAPQFDVDPTKGAASDTSTADTAAAGPNSLAHLGVASHFATQHTQNDTNGSDLESPVGSAAWNDELGTQLTWMTQKGLETGSLRVSPEHLGPVEVQISVQNGDASVWFGATHPDTRAALEQALPQLREMFASQGMTLTDSGVSREPPRNQTRSQAPQSISAVSAVSAVGSSDVSTAAAVRMSLGLVDTYA
jgi:flagellar hook-length control protein FliK